MCDKSECISKISRVADLLKSKYNVSSLFLFGSTARGENGPNSDIDIFIEMPPKAIALLSLKLYLEELLNTKIDLVRNHKNLNPVLLKEINKDGIKIF